MNPYVEAFLLMAAAAALGTVMTLLPTAVSFLLGTRRPRPKKYETYECGVPLQDTARRPVAVHFYLVAMAFILFDVEIAFLIPWAVAARGLGAAGLAAAGLFAGILALGLVYVWREGVLDVMAGGREEA